jgi:hypothetical protein
MLVLAQVRHLSLLQEMSKIRLGSLEQILEVRQRSDSCGY